MVEANKVAVVVEMNLEELGRISIALDGFDYRLHTNADQAAYKALQKKWDDLYKALHTARDLGVTVFRGARAFPL